MLIARSIAAAALLLPLSAAVACDDFAEEQALRRRSRPQRTLASPRCNNPRPALTGRQPPR